MGQFALSWCGSQTVGGAPDESHFTTLRTGGMGVQSVPFLKSKRNPGLMFRLGFGLGLSFFPNLSGIPFSGLMIVITMEKETRQCIGTSTPVWLRHCLRS